MLLLDQPGLVLNVPDEWDPGVIALECRFQLARPVPLGDDLLFGPVLDHNFAFHLKMGIDSGTKPFPELTNTR